MEIREILQAPCNTRLDKGVQAVKFVTGAALAAVLFWLANQSTMSALGIAIGAGIAKIVDSKTSQDMDFYKIEKTMKNDNSKKYIYDVPETSLKTRCEMLQNDPSVTMIRSKTTHNGPIGQVTLKGINPVLRGALVFAAFSSGLAALSASRGLGLVAGLKYGFAPIPSAVMLYMITNKQDAKKFALKW